MLQQRVLTLFSSLIFVAALGFGTAPSAWAACGKDHKHEHKHDHDHAECDEACKEACEDETCPRCGKDKAEKSCGHEKGMKEKASDTEESSPGRSRSPRVFEL